MAKQYSSPLMASIHETAEGLHSAGRANPVPDSHLAADGRYRKLNAP
jgi:hypothetical protein